MRYPPLLLLLTLAACQPSGTQSGLELREADAETIIGYIEDHPADFKVVNFWATWCGPCIKEFPDLMAVDSLMADRGVDVLFVSADFPEERPQILEFLQRQGVDELTFLKDEADDPFISAFSPDWTGSLPATIVYNRDDEPIAFWEGSTTRDALVEMLETFMAADAPTTDS
jgi:thiol-disulfide isomerase/thioredoxin